MSKPTPSANMLHNMNKCENGYANFSASLRLAALKLPELIRFVWSNYWFFHYLTCLSFASDVIMSHRDDILRSLYIYWTNLPRHSIFIAMVVNVFASLWYQSKLFYNKSNIGIKLRCLLSVVHLYKDDSVSRQTGGRVRIITAGSRIAGQHNYGSGEYSDSSIW